MFIVTFLVYDVLWLLMSGCCSLRPWDSMNDVIQYERDFVIQTKTHHQTPIVHTTGMIASNKDEKTSVASRGHSRHSSLDHASTATRTKRMSLKHVHETAQENASASAMCDSESSLSAGASRGHCVNLEMVQDKSIVTIKHKYKLDLKVDCSWGQ